ncbi:MAG: hypothetical protein WBN92_14590 [Terriglobia bacterium]
MARETGKKMRALMRTIVVVLLGVIAAVVEAINSRIYPLPAGVDPNNTKAMKEVIATLPLGALLMVLLGWWLGAFSGGWLAARLAVRLDLVHGLVVAVIILSAAIFNMLDCPTQFGFGWLQC